MSTIRIPAEVIEKASREMASRAFGPSSYEEDTEAILEIALDVWGAIVEDEPPRVVLPYA